MLENKSKYLRAIVIVATVLLLNITMSNRAAAQEVDYKSYTLFVYNFMKYIEWPEDNNKGNFVIGVLGNSPIIKELETLALTKKSKGRTIVIKKLLSAEEAGDCNLIYIASSKSNLLKKILVKTKDKPILLVAEREGLAGKGAALSFVTLEDDALKFDINKRMIESHNLKIPMALLSLGIVVG